MLCSSCKRKETSDGFKTCERCLQAKKRCYQKKKQRLQEDINHFNDYKNKMNYYCDYIRYAVEKINDNSYQREHIENIKKIMEFFDIYYERDLYINNTINTIKNEEVFKELKNYI